MTIPRCPKCRRRSAVTKFVEEWRCLSCNWRWIPTPKKRAADRAGRCP